MEVRTTWNLVQNEIQNARIHNLESAPGTPVEGQMYFNSSVGNKGMYYWDGTSWVQMGDSQSQPLDATLTALAGLTTSANKLILVTGTDTFSAGQLTNAYVNDVG